MRATYFSWTTALIVLLLLHGATARSAEPPTVIATFSIVAVDPQGEICGAAVASKYPAVGKVVPYVQAGVGAVCTQHWHEPKYGPRALELLEKKQSPHEVIAALIRDDRLRDQRQLAVIDMAGRSAQHQPVAAEKGSLHWSAASGRFYACQGNTLAGLEVTQAMAKAYESTDGSLADRLMAALLAGDQSGGDHRGRLAAGIRVAKTGVRGHWLELDIDESPDAITDLARKYAALTHEAKGKWSPKLPAEKPQESKRP